jgi:homocitrate synthase NifV
MQDFFIVDTTLRDGEQTAGVSFLEKDKILIAKKLDEAGVDIIEAGIPAMGLDEINRIRKIIELDLKAIILTWNRMNIDDINKSILTGTKNVHISVPASDIQINKKLNKNRKWVIEKLKEAITYSKEKNLVVSIGAEDASRAEFDYLLELFAIAKEFGATRIRYADTLGILDPFSTYENIKNIKDNLDIEIDFHGHNDFGMATANAISAYKAGAKYISCCVNGLGERAGNTALEEIIMALKYILNCETDFDFKKIPELSNLVERASGRKLHSSKPIVGKEVFSHESGIHVDGLVKNTENYEFFAPEDISRKRNIVLGKFSGIASIIYKFNEMGLQINKKNAQIILKIVKNINRYV